MLDKMLLPVRHRQVNSGGNMPLTIGGVAREAHVNVETVRYYQRRGLVAVPAVHPAGMRRYDEAAVKRIRFIKRAQALGFSLKEISGLLVLAEGRSCSDVCVAAERKLLEVERRIGELRVVHARLTRMVSGCRTYGTCPIVDELTDEFGRSADPALRPDYDA